MAAQKNVEQLQHAGIIAKPHKLSSDDQTRINSLTEHEVAALISARHKLGDDLIKKTAKGGQFPHPDSFSY
jgi:hypothetical protein